VCGGAPVPCPFAAHSCAGACATGTPLPTRKTDARTHLVTHYRALRRVSPLLLAAVPPELITAVHVLAFEPARAHFYHLYCCLRTPAGRVSQFLRSLDAPLADWPSLTPCGERAPCRAPATPSTLAEDPPGDIPDPAAPSPPSTSLRRHPRIFLRKRFVLATCGLISSHKRAVRCRGSWCTC
jgi:hypothetical protein